MKTKKWFLGIPVLLAVFAIAFTGCPQPEDPVTLSSDSTLASLTVAGVTVEDLGTPVYSDAELADIVAGSVTLQAAQLANAEIVATPNGEGASFRYAKVEGAAEPDLTTDATSFTFRAAGDSLYVRVLSANRDSVTNYKITITTPSTDTTLAATFTIGGASVTRGTAGTAWDNVTAPGSVTIPWADRATAAVVVSASNSGASIEYAKVLAANAANAPAFSAEAPVAGFEHGDILYVKVTANDGVTVAVYKIGVISGNSAVLQSLSIGGVSQTLPAAADTAAAAVAGATTLLEAASDYPIVAVANTASAGATITWVAATGAAEPVFPATPSANLALADGQFLYIKITSANGLVPKFYKLSVTKLNVAVIKYGQPNVADTNVIDTIWDTDGGEWLPIGRVGIDDHTTAFNGMVENGTVSGKAKVLWDESGMYVLARIVDPSISVTYTAANQSHLNDSLEVFIDENRVTATGSYENDGGQYRITATNGRFSDPTAAATLITKSQTWTFTEGTESGYYVEMQAPFRYTSAYPPVNGKVIGFELQINCVTGTARDGVLTWNNNAHTNYRRVEGFGEATLTGKVASPIANLTSATVGGKTATLGTPNIVQTSAIAGTVTLGTSQALSAVTVAVVKENAQAAVQYAVNGGAFADTASLTVSNGDAIYIKVVSENTSVTQYYRINVVTASDDATLSSLTIGGVPVTSLGTPGANYTSQGAGATVAGAVTLSSAQAALGTAVAAPTVAGATIAYGTSTSNNTAPVNWGPTGTGLTITGNNTRVAVRVTALDGTIRFYKILVTIQTGGASANATISSFAIGGVPANNLVTAAIPGATWNDGDIVNVAISLNSTQAAAGKALKVVAAESSVSKVEWSETGATSDGTEPTAWNVMTQDTGTATWRGALVAAQTTTNRRLYLRVTAEDTTTVNYYRVQVTYGANYGVVNTLTIGGTSVAVGNRGTPSGSWDDPAPVAGTVSFIGASSASITVAQTWSYNTGTNTVTYAVTSSFPVAVEPSFASSNTLTVSDGDYVWLRTVNGNYRNTYVVKVTLTPPPFTITVAGKAPSKFTYTTIASGSDYASGTYANVSVAPAAIQGIFDLTEAELTSAAVVVTLADGTAEGYIGKITYPDTTGTSDTVPIPTLTSGGTQTGTNLSATLSFSGKDILQIQVTPSSGTAVSYLFYVRKNVSVPYTASPPVIDGTLDATLWASAPEITIDRVFNGDTSNLSVADYDPARPTKIKLLWDETGLYMYARVWDTNIGTAAANHNTDCIEAFIAEVYNPGNSGTASAWTSNDTAANNGGQYRIDAANNKSGDPSNTTITGRINSAVTTVAETGEEGYIIEAKINWATASSNFINGKVIGADFQQAYAIGSTRNVVKIWNNFFHGSYQKAASAGILTLTGKP
jgi:hypothetical protein